MVVNGNEPTASERRQIAEAQRALAALQPGIDRMVEQHRTAIDSIRPAIKLVLERQNEIVTQLQPGIEAFVDNVRRIVTGLQPGLDALRRTIPDNLIGHLRDLEPLWNMSIDDGIAICWIPGSGILNDLITAESTNARLALLMDRRPEILADCYEILTDLDTPAAAACREAVAAAAAGHHGPAQSHAANVLDSFVLNIADRDRARARDFAAAGYTDDDVLSHTFDIIALAPIHAALENWFPGMPFPACRSRNVSTDTPHPTSSDTQASTTNGSASWQSWPPAQSPHTSTTITQTSTEQPPTASEPSTGSRGATRICAES